MAGLEHRAAAAATALLHGTDLDDVHALLTSAPFLLAPMVRRWAAHEPKAVSSARLLLALASPAQFRAVVTALAPKQQLELLAPPLLPIDLRLRALSIALEDNTAPLAWVQDACFLLEHETSDSFRLAGRDNVLRLTEQLRAYGPQSEQFSATLERLAAIGCPRSHAHAIPLSLPALRLPMDAINAMTAPTTGLCPVHVRRLRTLAASGPTSLSAVVVLAWDMDTFCKDHLEAPALGHGAELVQRTALHWQLCLSSLLDAFLEAATLERNGVARFLSGRRHWAHSVVCQLLRVPNASWSVSQSPSARVADTMAHLARVYAAWSIADSLHAVYDLLLGAEATPLSDAFWASALGAGAALVHHQNEASYTPVEEYLVARAASLVVSRGRHVDLANARQLFFDDTALAVATTNEALSPRLWSRVLHACLLRNDDSDWIRSVAIDDAVLCDAFAASPDVALALATAVATQLSYPRGRALLCRLVDRNRAIASVRAPSWPSRVLLSDVLGDMSLDDAWTSHSNALVRFFVAFDHDGADGKALWARCCADDKQFLDALFFSLVTSSRKTSDRCHWTRLWNQIVLWLRQTGSAVAEMWASHLVPPSATLVAYGERYTHPNATGLPMSPLRLETLLRIDLETNMPLDLRALTAFLLHTAVHCVDMSQLEHLTLGVATIRGWLLNDHWSNVLQTALTRISASELPNWICITSSWVDLPWARVLEQPHVSAALVTLLWQAPAHTATLQQWFNLPALRTLPITSCIIHAARQSLLLGSHASWMTFATTLAQAVIVPTKATSTIGFFIGHETSVSTPCVQVGGSPAPFVALDCASWIALLGYCDDPRLAPLVHITLMQLYLPTECKGDIDALGQAILTGVLRLSLAQKRVPSWLASPCHLVCTSSSLHPCSWLLRSLKRIATASSPMNPTRLSHAMMTAIDALFLPHMLKTAISTQPSATQWLIPEVRQALHAHAVFRSVGLGPLLIMCLVLAFVVHVPPTDATSVFEIRVHALLQRDRDDVRTMLSDTSVDALVASYCAMQSAKASAFLARLRNTNVPVVVVSDEPLAKRPRHETAPPLVWSNLLHDDAWRQVLTTEFEKAYMRRLAAFLALEAERGHQLCPPVRSLLAAFDACPLESVRVVVLGAEPYASIGKATGLCFALPPAARVSTSLQALFDELGRDSALPQLPSASLESWAKQGVLLLNAVLSVRANTAGSHANQGWELFLEAVLRILNRVTSHSVFLLLGAALPKRNVLINGAKHLLLDCNDGVHGSHCFSKINAYLEKHRRGRIEWTRS
ncbi:hypothetical protein SDRG_09222 [Saprolegnia diclina VS20]|uniref:Uracil-DNA glycosylase-like domain-containing protein n=1 Tax=Saprolegnia diclina (strain VS20) TaxID=1156394 RepID=T0Q5U1_SAPDV|nr:hypothetical protein SDRG_09222 [Saprolegnia diclina VS20]EQC33239.1 hypothetical protein SDRG_09222 [Saprolegnia diclina VS20]|eukprot:XP_008613362.1 hypothetical protein SDRG_09222 [Saprolegnia diclina VS20]